MRFQLHGHICLKLSYSTQTYVSSPTSLNSRIKTLVRQREYKQALKLYSKNRHSPVKTTVFTYPSLLKACAFLSNLKHGKTIHSTVISLGLGCDSFVAASLINMYVKCGSLDYAVHVFDKLSESKVSVEDVAIWNSVIDGYFRFDRVKEGLARFCQMRAGGVRPDPYSFCIVLGVLGKNEVFGCVEGKIIHGYMIRNMLNGDAFLEIALIDMYLRFGLLTDAWRVFVGIEDKKNIVAWNVMIGGFYGNGFCEYSLELYSLAKTENVKPASTSFSSALTACRHGENRGFGRQVHCDVVKMGFENDSYVCTSLLTMYAKCRLVEEAENVFFEIQDKGLELWNAMVAAYAGNDCGYDALRLYNWMRNSKLLPDSFTLSNVLSCCGKLGLYGYGRSVHAELVKRLIQSDTTTQSALLTMYCKCGSEADASLVFNKMEERDTVAWGSMLSGFCQNKKFEEALKFFRTMKNENVKPDSNIMASVINACTGLEILRLSYQVHGYVVKIGVDLDVFVTSSLIDMYSKNSLPDMAGSVFCSMSHKNLVAWNSMISCYCRNNLPEISVNFFQKILELGLSPDSVTIASVLAAISSTAGFLKGKSVHGYTMRLNIPSDTHVENALVDMYIKCGFLKYAEIIFKNMLYRNLVSWNLMISGYGSHGDCLAALSLFDEMTSSGTIPDDVTFLALLSACNHSGFVDQGKKLFKSMTQEYGTEPKLDHYTNMVDLLGRAGRLEEAFSFVRTMHIQPDRSIWLSLLSGSRAHGKVELGELAAHKLLDIEPGKGSNYVQLINLYAEAGLRDKAAAVRAEMKEKGLKKSPGCSWIELKSRIYVFFSGDSLSEGAEIYDALSSVKKNMEKTEGKFEIEDFLCIHST